MIRRSFLLPAAIAVLLQSSLGFAQGPATRAMPPERFESAPQLGESLPDLTIVDDEGNPVNLRELAREHYTVLVLGCLT